LQNGYCARCSAREQPFGIVVENRLRRQLGYASWTTKIKPGGLHDGLDVLLDGVDSQQVAEAIAGYGELGNVIGVIDQ
jgi:hypothetical protein